MHSFNMASIPVDVRDLILFMKYPKEYCWCTLNLEYIAIGGMWEGKTESRFENEEGVDLHDFFLICNFFYMAG